MCQSSYFVKKLKLKMFRGRMIPERLEELVIKHKKEGHLPFFVNCTTGILFIQIPPPNLEHIVKLVGSWKEYEVAGLVVFSQ